MGDTLPTYSIDIPLGLYGTLEVAILADDDSPQAVVSFAFTEESGGHAVPPGAIALADDYLNSWLMQPVGNDSNSDDDEPRHYATKDWVDADFWHEAVGATLERIS